MSTLGKDTTVKQEDLWEPGYPLSDSIEKELDYWRNILFFSMENAQDASGNQSQSQGHTQSSGISGATQQSQQQKSDTSTDTAYNFLFDPHQSFGSLEAPRNLSIPQQVSKVRRITLGPT